MSCLDTVIALWSDPRILLLATVIFGMCLGAAVGEWRERRR